VDEDPSLPFLDAWKTTVIRDSRWRCEHGWDVDLDDGSSNYDIYNNLMLCGGLKLREGFRRRAWNNIVINNGLSSHVWFQNSKDQVTGNIMARASGPYIQRDVTVDGLVDKNLYYDSNEGKLTQLQEKFGWDRNSIAGDPLFVDPENGDFSVKEGSPAFAVGFKNFPMDQFGVKKPSLKAIARTPSFGPKPRKAAAPPKPKKAVAPQIQVWEGATLHSLQGNEFSAYGVSKEDGGVALREVRPGSAMAQAGFKEGDLIQGLNGRKVTHTDDLFKILTAHPAASYEVAMVRNQKDGRLRITPRSTVLTESASTPDGFSKLPVPAASDRKVTANRSSSDGTPDMLTNGQLARDWGPIFQNTVFDGAYKMDLGAVKPVTAVTSWSFNMGGGRGMQKLTVYGSSASKDPGWDPDTFTALGSIDTTGLPRKDFTAASLCATSGALLGNFRWILWRVSPVTSQGGGENTAFQELTVETR
jgi:hypothetical protein